jgi:hypothetical protein
LPLVFLIAATVVDGRHVFRRQRVSLALVAGGFVVALAIGPSRVLGAYSSVSQFHVGAGLAHWIGIDTFLLACCAGVVIVPGAVIGLLRVRGREQVAFAALTGTLGVSLIAEAALFGSNDLERFQERYLFVVLPLIPIAFCLYLKNGRPWRPLAMSIAVLLAVVAPRLPLATYTAAGGVSDSPSLIAVAKLEVLIGTGNTSLLIAVTVSALALGAVVVALGRAGRIALGVAVALSAVTAVGAIAGDATYSQNKRDASVAADPSWVDAAVNRPVTLVQTQFGPSASALQLLYWNERVTKEMTLGAAEATDNYATSPAVTVEPDGRLRGVGSTFVFQSYAATAQFADARPLARYKSLLLLATPSTPRLRVLETGRYRDGWLTPSGKIQVWPDPDRSGRRVLHFRLSVPARTTPVRIRFGRTIYTVRSGRSTRVALPVAGGRAFVIPFKAQQTHGLPDLRFVSVRATRPVVSAPPGG